MTTVAEHLSMIQVFMYLRHGYAITWLVIVSKCVCDYDLLFHCTSKLRKAPVCDVLQLQLLLWVSQDLRPSTSLYFMLS